MTEVVKNYVDNRIRNCISEHKTPDEIIDALNQRIDRTRITINSNSNASLNSKKNLGFIIKCANKRIRDIYFIKGSSRFKDLSPNKMLDLIKLRDKLSGFKYEEDY